MPNNHKHKIEKSGKGFKVGKSDSENIIDTVKNNKGNPSNADIVNLLLGINDKLDQVLEK